MASTRRPFLRGCLAFSLLPIGGCGGSLCWAWDRGLTVSKIERWIRKEIPRGCDRKTVEAWFDRHKLDYGWSDNPNVGGVGRQSFVELAGLRQEELRGALFTTIDEPEVNVDLFCPGEISICFFFDKRGRLAGHLAHAFVMMP